MLTYSSLTASFFLSSRIKLGVKMHGDLLLLLLMEGKERERGRKKMAHFNFLVVWAVI